MDAAIGTFNFLDVSANLGIIAIAAAMLMIGGEFDLSIGSMIGFAGGCMAMILKWGFAVVIPYISFDGGFHFEGLKLFDISEITPGILPLTQDLSAFARQLKSTLGEEEKDQIRLTIQNIESLTSELDTFIYNYRNIVTDKDKKNFQEFMKNLNGTIRDLKYGVNRELNKM